MHTKRLFFMLLLSISIMLGLASVAYAHGVVINYTVNEETGELEFEALFDNGEPMANAQVTIYAPDDPAKPWLTAKADENGRYAFAPDQVGEWDVQFRVAGHGDIVHINIEAIFEPAEVTTEANVAEVEAEAVTEAVAAENAPEATVVAADGNQAGEAVAEVAHTGSTDMEHNMEQMTHDASPQEDTAAEGQAIAAGEATAKEAAAETKPAASPRIVVSSGSSSSSAGGFTVAQILLMSASVIWGFIGTALYFQSKRVH